MLTIEVLENPLPRVEAALAIEEDVPILNPRPRIATSLDAEAAYSIRVPREVQKVECPRCGEGFLAAGPTGYCAGLPVCDRCLFEGSHQLGMLMALASVTRGFGQLVPTSQKHASSMLVSLGGFARVYEQFAARYGPARVFRVELNEIGL